VIGEAALVMSEADTVATALEDLDEGRELAVAGAGRTDRETVTLREDVPFGHKVALTSIDEGEPVHKYGEVIGRASAAIEPGERVHTHNCESQRGRGDIDAQEGEA